jgi:Dual specificity phosphatase, catalytic domain
MRVAPRAGAVADCPSTMDIVAVNPGETLFVSGDIEDWEAIRRLRIGVIVDMDGAVDRGLPQTPDSIFYVYHPIRDEDLPNVAKLEALGRLVADLVGAGHRVLVHCRMGFNRSALVIATALTYTGLSGQEALEDLRRRRPGALFNEVFAAHVAALPPRRISIETL